MILDIGCGKSKRGDIGIDYSRDSDADVIADAEHLPFRTNIFEQVNSFSCIEHSPNPLNFLREIHRALKENGRLLLVADNGCYYRWTVQRLGGTNRHDHIAADHHVVFFVDGLIRLLEKAGFQKVRWRYRLHNPVSWDFIAKLFVRLGFWRSVSLYSHIVIVTEKHS